MVLDLAKVLELAKAFGRVRLPVCVGLGDALQSSQEVVASALRQLRTPAEGAVRRICGGAAPDHHSESSRVEMELLLNAHCAAGRTE